jgi:hypothetical protein
LVQDEAGKEGKKKKAKNYQMRRRGRVLPASPEVGDCAPV